MPRLPTLTLTRKHTNSSTPPDVSSPRTRPKSRTRPYLIKRLSLLRKMPRRRTSTPSAAKMTIRDLGMASLSKPPNGISKEAHFKRARIYDMTKDSIRHKTAGMFVTSMRGFNRHGFVPTKRHRPALRERRYSIDVSTNGWPNKLQSICNTDDVAMPAAGAVARVLPKAECLEMDFPIQPASHALLPDTSRFSTLNRLSFWPPYDCNTYLELGNSSLTNQEFLTIRVFDNMDSWMADNILNVALELLSKRFLCEENNIEIANSMISSIMWQAGQHGDVDKNNFASYKEERKRFGDKKWIFLPINDGFGSIVNNGSGGTHWSLLAVNRLKGVAHYIDSLFVYDFDHQEIARTVMKGLTYILEEPLYFCIEDYSPDQRRNNLSGRWDWGPCAPFVYRMIQSYVESVRTFQDLGREDILHLHMSVHYPEEFGMWFDSLKVREDMARDIAFAARLLNANRAAREHDEAALTGETHVSFVETAGQDEREPGNEEQI